jgi:peptidoglycan/LPS O-acetylase OafA/YrhL
MSIDHTVASRAAGFATTLLVLVQLMLLLEGGHASYVNALLFSLVAVTGAAGSAMQRTNSIESRLGVGLMAALSGGGVLLVATVGIPGQDQQAWGPLQAITLGLSVAVIAALTLCRPRRPADRRSEKSYAS